MLKNSNRGISTLVAIGIIAVLVVVVGGGILAYQHYYIPQRAPNNQQAQNQNNQNTNQPPQIAENSTANWQTYTNQNYSISYPNDATIDQSHPSCVIIKNGPNSIYIYNSAISYTPSVGVMDEYTLCGNTTGRGIENASPDENLNIGGVNYIVAGMRGYSGHWSFTYTDKVSILIAGSVSDSIKQILSTLKSSQAPTTQLRIISPAGGETFIEGQTYTIKWTGGTGNYNVYVSGVGIGDQGFIGSAKASDGLLQWIVGNFADFVPGSTARIYFAYANTFAPVAYSNYFTIVAANSSQPQYKTGFDGGTLYGSLYRSDNNGNTWKEILRRYKSRVVYAFDSKNASIIYAGDTGFNMMGEGPGASLFKSTDKGETWTDVSQSIRNQIGMIYGVSSISVDLNNSNIIKTTVNSSTTQGINFTSTDYGNTWAKQSY